MATSSELASEMAKRVTNQRKTTLSWTPLDQSQVHFLANKISPLLVKQDHGIAGNDDHCLMLPVLSDKSLEHKKTTALKRQDRPTSKHPRGAYLKMPYSFSGSYAQVTLNKTENGGLKMKGTKRAPPFPKTRTFQVTHVVLRNAGKEPPVEDRFIYTASHLCGFPSCLRASHLMWETLPDNWSRRMCHSYCVKTACPHNPKCLYRAADHLVQESAISNDVNDEAATAVQEKEADDSDFEDSQ